MVSPLSDSVIACLPELRGAASRAEPDYAALKRLATGGDEGALEVLANLAARKDAIGARAAQVLRELHRDASKRTAPRLRQSIENLAYHMTAIGIRNPGLATTRPVLRDLGQAHARRCMAAPRHPHTASAMPQDFSLEDKDITACFRKRPLKSMASPTILYVGRNRMGPALSGDLDTQLTGITRSLKKKNDRACTFVNSGRHWMLFIFERSQNGKIKIHGFDSNVVADQAPQRLQNVARQLERGLGTRFGGAELAYAGMQDHTGNTCGLLCMDMAYRIDAGLRDAPGSRVQAHMNDGINTWNAIPADVQLAYAYERYGEIATGIRGQGFS